jgi:hypothetical protein
MARNAIILNNPHVRFADTEAGLGAADAFECQITSAALTPQPQYNTIPATGCAGATQSPGRTGWQLDLAWLQDWGSDPSMSAYAYAHDALPVWYELELDSIGLPGEKATGQAYATAGAYGGTFGDGSAATATATWPALAAPSIPSAQPPTPASGATAGTPGTWTPGGSVPPANAAAATSSGVVASPATAWTTGQYVQGSTAGTGGEMNWTGSAWAAGKAS